MRSMYFAAALSAIMCASVAWGASTTKKATTSATSTRWQAQDLKGTISMVDPQQDLVVVRDSSGVPFDIRVRRSTHIDKGQTPVKLSELTKNQSVDIRYIPETRGDMARQIEVQR